MDVIKYLKNKGKRILPITSATVVITKQGTTAQYELDKLRNDIKYYLEIFDPDYIVQIHNHSQYAKTQGDFANRMATYISENKENIDGAVKNSEYAREQGNYAKQQAGKVYEQLTYIRENIGSIQKSVANSEEAKRQAERAEKSADYIEANRESIEGAIDASEEALLFARYAKCYKNYVDTFAFRSLHGSRIFNIAEPTEVDLTVQNMVIETDDEDVTTEETVS